MKGSHLNFQHEPVDIAIYYSDGKYPGFYHQRLFDEYLTPVCSPDYYQQLFGQGPLEYGWEILFKENDFYTQYGISGIYSIR